MKLLCGERLDEPPVTYQTLRVIKSYYIPCGLHEAPLQGTATNDNQRTNDNVRCALVATVCVRSSVC